MELGCIQHVYQETIAKSFFFFLDIMHIVKKVYSTHIYMKFSTETKIIPKLY